MGNVVWEWYKTNLECLLVGIKGTPAGDRYSVNDTVQLLYINLLMEDCLWWALIAHVTFITAVMIVGCQCITMVLYRYQFFKQLVNQHFIRKCQF